MLSEGSRRSASAIAVAPTETLSMARPLFAELRSQSPAVDRFVQAVLAAQVERLSARLVEALHAPADTRILRRLVDLIEIYGDTGIVRIPITQDDLASLAGTTRPTVNRLLKALERDGIVAVSRGTVAISDGELLRRRARSVT